MELLSHPFAPVFDSRSRILILGSFPSVKSRENAFYYGHPQNRFWRVLAAVLDCPVPVSVEEKTAFLLRRRIALWDVIASCRIEGSSDSSIRDAMPNDLSRILGHAPVKAIFCNGAEAFSLYRHNCEQKTGRPAVRLPSTSPANAAWTLPRLTEAWRAILLPEAIPNE